MGHESEPEIMLDGRCSRASAGAWRGFTARGPQKEFETVPESSPRARMAQVTSLLSMP